MKYAADFRELARNALRGKWGIAVIVERAERALHWSKT